MHPFKEHHDVKRSAKRLLIFYFIFIPLFIYGVYMFEQSYPLPFSGLVIFLCGAMPIIIAIGCNVILARCKHPLRWIVTSSNIIYESPSRIFGRSFNVPISDVASIIDLGSEHACCVMISGESVKFSIKHRGGRSFYAHLVKHYNKESKKTIEPSR